MAEADSERVQRSVFVLVGGAAKRIIEILMVTCLAVMTVMVFGNVVLRYLFSSGIAISEEAARYLFVWLTFLGAVIGVAEGTHLGMESFVQFLPVWGKKLCLGFCQILILLCCWLFFDGSWDQTIVNLDNHAPVSDVSLAFIYSVGLLSSAAIGLLVVRNLFRLVTGRMADDELVQVRESEDSSAQSTTLAGQPRTEK